MSNPLVGIDRPVNGLAARARTTDRLAAAAADRVVVIILGRVVAAGAGAAAMDLTAPAVEAGRLAALVPIVAILVVRHGALSFAA
jgi:hypothetical protein